MTHSCDSITSPCIKHLAIQVIRTKVTTGDCQLSSIATKTVSMHHNTVNTSHIGGLVSIHAPLAGRDITEHTAAQEHSVSGARHHRTHRRAGAQRFNSRTPRGARLLSLGIMRSIPLFQFTCPSRSTTKGDGQSLPNNVFQFTCPSRSTTNDSPERVIIRIVSIHVPSRSTT